MKRLLYLVLAFAIALANFTPLAASAATTSPNLANQSYQISPPTSVYSANPGQTVTGNIKVTNLSQQALTLNIGKENFAAKGEEGEIELTDNGDPLYSLAPWFNTSTTQITIPALQTKTFTYTIAVPVNAEPGGRYGSITFNTIAPRLPSGGSGASVQQQLAAIVFLRINGAANEKLSVASFDTGTFTATKIFTKKTFFEYAPLDIQTRVKNDGNVHEQPTGTITIKNIFGFTVATLPLDQHYVIPGAIRRLHNDYPSSNKKKILFGHYTAQLNATYANGQKLTATTSFTVIPYKIVAGVLIALIVIFLVFWRGRKRLKRAMRILAGRE